MKNIIGNVRNQRHDHTCEESIIQNGTFEYTDLTWAQIQHADEGRCFFSKDVVDLFFKNFNSQFGDNILKIYIQGCSANQKGAGKHP